MCLCFCCSRRLLHSVWQSTCISCALLIRTRRPKLTSHVCNGAKRRHTRTAVCWRLVVGDHFTAFIIHTGNVMCAPRLTDEGCDSKYSKICEHLPNVDFNFTKDIARMNHHVRKSNSRTFENRIRIFIFFSFESQPSSFSVHLRTMFQIFTVARTHLRHTHTHRECVSVALLQ